MGSVSIEEGLWHEGLFKNDTLVIQGIHADTGMQILNTVDYFRTYLQAVQQTFSTEKERRV